VPVRVRSRGPQGRTTRSGFAPGSFWFGFGAAGARAGGGAACTGDTAGGCPKSTTNPGDLFAPFATLGDGYAIELGRTRFLNNTCW
jgi:hypothetical protein